MAHKWYDEINGDAGVIIRNDELDETLRSIQEMAEEGICDDTVFFSDGIDRDGILSPSDINDIW